ncbi:MAG: SDR family NAD(P)-dependent oxidoreductase [Muribaculaceae bacterium]|nr:SDR family NAD(P)-dependent oxidoreductase [Muribaculaceae bacterium]
MNLPRRVVIIGASSGIGREVARIYISLGCRVGVAARRVEPLLELKALAPDRVDVAAIDVTDPEAPAALLPLLDVPGGTDTLLIASGVGFRNPALDISKELSIVATNALGFTRIADDAFSYFSRALSSAVIPRATLAAITSVAGTKGMGDAPAYSASKRFGSTYLTALSQLAHTRRLPLSTVDIRPGFVATDFLAADSAFPMTMDPSRVARLIVRAISRRRPVAVIDWRWRIVVSLWRLIPRWLWIRIPLSRG